MKINARVNCNLIYKGVCYNEGDTICGDFNENEVKELKPVTTPIEVSTPSIDETPKTPTPRKRVVKEN